MLGGMSGAMAVNDDYSGGDPCSLANAIQIVGEKWTFFILREALAGTSRFGEFRERLGIASDVLTARLETLVQAKIFVRRDYQEAGQRTRPGYHLTTAGRRLALSILALQQWGDEFTPSRTKEALEFRNESGAALRAAFVDEQGIAVDPDDVELVRIEGE